MIFFVPPTDEEEIEEEIEGGREEEVTCWMAWRAADEVVGAGAHVILGADVPERERERERERKVHER